MDAGHRAMLRLEWRGQTPCASGVSSMPPPAAQAEGAHASAVLELVWCVAVGCMRVLLVRCQTWRSLGLGRSVDDTIVVGVSQRHTAGSASFRARAALYCGWSAVAAGPRLSAASIFDLRKVPKSTAEALIPRQNLLNILMNQCKTQSESRRKSIKT